MASSTRDDDELLAVSGILTSVIVKRRRRQRTKNRTKWRKEWLDINHMPLVRELRNREPEDFRNYVRMDPETFDTLLEMVGDKLKKNDTVMRQAISPEERLLATLRFLASGRFYNCLRFSAGIAEQTLGYIIPETCKVLFEVLSEKYMKLPQSREEWIAIAEKFNQRWNFINCAGALDGKHIRIRRPPHSSALFYNYKNFHSIVLMALVDADYRFIWIDVGKQGRLSDGGVFEWTGLSHKMKNDLLKFPPAAENPLGLEYVFVADDAFALGPHMLKPYAQKGLTYEKRIFNYRVSRARNVVENAFGVLTSRFRIFHTPLQMSVEGANYVVAAACALHNFLLTRDKTYANSSTFDNPQSLEGEGQWRNEEHANLTSLRGRDMGKYLTEVKAQRDTYCRYFNTAGKVPWQDKMLQKGKA